MVASDDVCPVCLDMLADSDTLKLPGCEHVIHVSCALSCAQYDSRCPICRNVTVTPRPQDDIFTHFEEELNERLTSYRLYRARRGRVISYLFWLWKIFSKQTGSKKWWTSVIPIRSYLWIFSMDGFQWMVFICWCTHSVGVAVKHFGLWIQQPWFESRTE